MKKFEIMLLAFVLTGCSLGYSRSIQVPLKAQYGKPAKNWESEALPIGNGYMGAMIFGGVAHDVIQTNEKTLWSGGQEKMPIMTADIKTHQRKLMPRSRDFGVNCRDA